MTNEQQDYYIVKIEQTIAKKNNDKATEYLDIIKNKKDISQLILYEEAKINYIKRNFSKADQITKSLLEKNKFNPILWELYGHCLLAQGNVAEALNCFQYFDDIIDNAKSKFMVGLCNFLLGNNEIAMTYFKQSYTYNKHIFGRLVINTQQELFELAPKEAWEKLIDALNKLI